MKNIFTYPNNASTNYIDPLYDGADNTEGLRKRINELRTGTYLSWNGTAPSKTTPQLMQDFSKYINYIDYHNTGNVKIYDLWQNDIVEFTMREKGFTVDQVSSEVSGSQGVLRFQTILNHGLVDGDRVNFKDLVDTGGYDIDQFNNTSDTVYAKKISNTEIELYSDSGLNTPYTIGAFESNIDDWVMISDTDDGNVVFFYGRGQGNGAPFEDSDSIQVVTAMSTVTGTANPASGSTLYFDKIGNENIYSMKTDSALTTDAVLSNEQYYNGRGNFYYYPTLNGRSVTLQNLSVAFGASNFTAHGGGGGSGSQTAHDALTDFLSNSTGKVLNTSDSNIKTGFCRLYHNDSTNPGAYYQTSDAKAASNGTAPTTDEYFVFNYNVSNKTITICNSWDMNNSKGLESDIHDYELYIGSGSGSSFYNVFVEFVDLSIHAGVWNQPATVPLTVGKVATHPIVQTDGTTPYYEVDGISVTNYGNRTFKQRTGESTYAFNAELENKYWTAGATTETAMLTDETTATPDITGNGSYYFTGISQTNTNQRGTYRTNDTKVHRLTTVADTYTPAALSTEAQQDVWDLDTEWDDQSFSTLKTFPTAVTPSNITVRTTSPNATSQSQNGTKYARSSGYSKYSIDVSYPAMTAEQYLDYNGFINALNGQKHPFFFNIKQNNTQLFGRKGDYTVNGLRIKDAASAGDTTVLIEGFATNQTDAVTRGELFLVGDGKHGNVKTVGSSTDANAYGEAKFRFTTPLHTSKSTADEVYNNPQHIVVSLDADTVEVTRDTAGYYYLSMTFTADEWK